MNNIRNRHLLLQMLCAVCICASASGCGDDASSEGPDASADADTDADTDSDTDTDTDSDTDTDADGGTDAGAEESWEGAAIDVADAPDEYTVTVGFSGAPPSADAGDAAIYALTSDVGDLAISAVAYDAETAVATLTTDKQKLGITYTVTVTPPAAASDPMAADFPSADTAMFYAYDFGTGGQY
jgi:hypothetical protein